MPANPRVRTNNVQGTTTDNPLTNVATTMNSAGLANLAAISSQHAVLILDPLRAAGAPEIVVVTAHTGAATSATITRGAYGTSARQHASGTLWVHAPITEDFLAIVTSSTRPSDPYRGQAIFETDTDKFYGRSIADAWQQIVDLGAWDTYVPVVTQSGTVTHTATRATYTRMGRTIHFNLNLSMTGTGTGANQVTVTLPVTAASANIVAIGTGHIYDSSANLVYPGTVEVASTTTLLLRPQDQIIAPGALGASVFTAALASGDLIRACGTYEAAS